MEEFRLTEEQRYQKAKKKAKEIREFYYHLTAYCVIIPIIITINLVFVPEFHWFWFTVFGWGTGLTIHALSTFGFVPFLGQDWEERKIREIMEKERQRKNNFSN
jgi:hypothetical protein